MRNAFERGSPILSIVALITAGATCGCDFHDGRLDGEFNAGGADPYNYPPPYRGTGARREVAASGVFTEIAAHAGGHPVGYYLFPFSPGQVPTTSYPAPSPSGWPDGVIDPLRVSGPGTAVGKSSGNPVPVPLVYNFDSPGGPDPLASSAKCTPPAGYTPNAYHDAFPRNEQWNVFDFPPDRFTTFPFGGLPTWSYRPVVAEVAVTTEHLGCQDVKSERTLLDLAERGSLQLDRMPAQPDGTRPGKPDGRYLAWALIDPGAAVVRVGETVDVFQGGKVSGTSIQKYGWYAQFIVAYIDGGYIPVEDGPMIAGAPTQRMRPQRLYYPRSPVIDGDSAAPGALAHGYDVLEADRFQDPDAYSPVCEVWTYALPAPTAVADLPKDEATILAMAGDTLEPARTQQSSSSFRPDGGGGPPVARAAAIVPPYIFCLQAAPRP